VAKHHGLALGAQARCLGKSAFNLARRIGRIARRFCNSVFCASFGGTSRGIAELGGVKLGTRLTPRRSKLNSCCNHASSGWSFFCKLRAKEVLARYATVSIAAHEQTERKNENSSFTASLGGA